MLNADNQSPPGFEAVPAQLTAAESGPQDGLEVVLAEVHALAIQLRRRAGVVQPEGRLQAGGQKVLQILDHHGPRTVPQIARLHSSSRQNIQVLVNHLAAEGWIEFTTNPAHKRSDLVRLTERGKALAATAAEHTGRFLHSLSSHLSEAEVRSAADFLRRLRQLLAGATGSKPRAPRPARKAPRSASPGKASPPASLTERIEPPRTAATASPPEEDEFPINLL